MASTFYADYAAVHVLNCEERRLHWDAEYYLNADHALLTSVGSWRWLACPKEISSHTTLSGAARSHSSKHPTCRSSFPTSTDFSRSLTDAVCSVVGTPGFLSPDQLQLDKRDLDFRSDLFSLGICIYQRLTGQHPF
jgi:serine/threonine protein kinase